MDRLLITGDVTDLGDTENLLLARQWIYSTLEIGNKETTSIGLDSNLLDRLRIIPGNHDAFNNKSANGSILEKRQTSLENFNYVFPEHQFDPIEGCHFDWIQKEEHAIFLVFLDSSYLGDPETDEYNPGILQLAKMGKGKISLQQTEYVLELFDKGMKGRLKFNSLEINPKLFKNSLKILVMHHYLFEPKGYVVEHFLHMEDRNKVFANLLQADFDILLCGHKHIADFNNIPYIEHVDKRARGRYLFNYFRRLIGTHSLPVQFVESNGRLISKINTLILASLTKVVFYNSNNQNFNISDFDFLNNLTDTLFDGLENPKDFEDNLKSFFKNNNSIYNDKFTISDAEIKDLVKRVKIELNDETRAKLKTYSAHIKKVINDLSDREFLQVMSGSACKSNNKENKIRSFNIYDIIPTAEGYRFTSTKSQSNNSLISFEKVMKSSKIEFNLTNRPKY
jgi:3',5'-cyclic AMP phosphodiesterase CpdA